MILRSFMSRIKRLMNLARHSFFLFGLLSILWFLFRTGAKPSRMSYPCQQASATSGSLWITAYVLPLILAVRSPRALRSKSKRRILAGFLIVLASLLFVSANLFNTMGDDQIVPAAQGDVVGLGFSEKLAKGPGASNIFVVNGTSGNDRGVKELIELMQARGQSFNSQESSAGIIGKDDVVIIKVNCQWDERGGTNTDLVKALVQAIVEHPQGFTGEVVIADNGQARGSLNYARSNAQDNSQSMQKVADSFPGHWVSTYLWDTITNKRVKEYSEADLEDGYVAGDAPKQKTGIVVTYPKFRTKYGTNVSFKMGIWDPANKTYDSGRLKVINVPVLKSHRGYGVTASVKHYMGVVSDRISREQGGWAHNSVGSGGMGTEMVQTRFPALNIVDAIWVNANPGEGPGTPYGSATKTSVIAASTDPVALDYWAAKSILMPAASAKGHSDLSSMDPDNTSPGYFGDWLRRSMEEILEAGYPSTLDEDRINVYVAQTGVGG
jgi:uncharacterized protein (DUF362 family)